MTCELAGQPIFIDGRVPCHCCGRTVKALLVDGLWVYAEHNVPAVGCDDFRPFKPNSYTTRPNPRGGSDVDDLHSIADELEEVGF